MSEEHDEKAITAPEPPEGEPAPATGAAAAAEPRAPGSVMSIHAHPDDQEFTVAGTLAKWARAGSRIITVCITAGGAGSNSSTPAAMTPEALEPIRRDEQRRACARLGIETTVFLGYPDGLLEPTLGLRRDLTRLIRRYRPEAIVCGDPTVRFYGQRYMNHPDHRVAADVALDAVFPSAPTRFIFPELLAEGLAPHQVKAVFLHGADRPDTWIDIADFVDVKIAALKEHRTQMGDWDPAPMIKEWAAMHGKKSKLAAAEAFRLMQLSDAD